MKKELDAHISKQAAVVSQLQATETKLSQSQQSLTDSRLRIEQLSQSVHTATEEKEKLQNQGNNLHLSFSITLD